MTPAINAASRAGIAYTVHRYDHDPAAASWGEEAADRLGLGYDQVFKTLVVGTDTGGFAVGVVPVAGRLSMKRMAQALGVKKVTMAQSADVERVTGYVLGGVSPLGQKRRLATVIDASAQAWETVYVSAGRRGLQIELAPQDLARLAAAVFATIVDERGINAE